MPRRNRPVEFWLEQIIHFADRLAIHLAGAERHTFVVDPKTMDAASWCISCIGEACGKILEIDRDMEKRFPALQLSAAYLARNRYVHGYFDLDIGQVWDTARESVPSLAAAARQALDASRSEWS